MWAHYANGHRGVAFEFDAHLLNSHFVKVDKLKESPLEKIIYSDEVPSVSCEDFYEAAMGNRENINKKLRIAARIKSNVWKSESEWRFFEKNDKTELDWLRREIPADSIKSIYLGCRIDKGVTDKIISEKNRVFPSAEIFQAKQHEGKFVLDFEKL